MESIRELRKICQESQAGVDTWQDKLVCRRFSIYITRILLHTKMSAMQATSIFLLTGFIPGIAFASSHYLAGAILLQIWYVFDGVDGEIARYRRQTSITGAYFDSIIHYIIHPYIFICVGYGLYKDMNSIAPLLLSVSAAISSMLISAIHDLKNSVLFNAGRTKVGMSKKNVSGRIDSPAAAVKRVFSLLHKVCTYPTIMNLVTIAAFLNAFVFRGALYYLIAFYGVAATVVWVGKLCADVSQRKLD